MDKGAEEEMTEPKQDVKMPVRVPWKEWYDQQSKVIQFDLGQIATFKEQKRVVGFDWVESLVERQSMLLDILNDHRGWMNHVEVEVNKLIAMLGPLEPYLPALKRYAEEQKRLDEERERLR
jgi:hypothetical protein